VKVILICLSFIFFIIISPNSLADSTKQDQVTKIADSNYKDYFERKNGFSEESRQKSISEEQYIAREVGREANVMDYIKVHPEIIIGQEFSGKYDISAKRIKLKYLIGALSRLGGKIYLSPNSRAKDKIKDITLKDKNIKEVGMKIANRYGVSIKYFRTSGLYVVE